nr:MAG TPA: hypothetical protein [Caudoviricetes sp.]
MQKQQFIFKEVLCRVFGILDKRSHRKDSDEQSKKQEFTLCKQRLFAFIYLLHINADKV